MADIITVGPTNTISVQANTPVQLVAGSGGRTNFFILNTGPGNLYLRYNQEPAGAGDPASVELPPFTEWFTNFPVSGGNTSRDGVFALADQAGTISVIKIDNPLPAPTQGIINIGGGGGGGQNQSPWLSDIQANGYRLTGAGNITSTGTIASTGNITSGGVISTPGRISASIVGVGTASPAYSVDVVGDVNVTGTYRVNGTPFAALALVQSAVPPTTLANGSLWFDSGSLVLYILLNGAWIGV